MKNVNEMLLQLLQAWYYISFLQRNAFLDMLGMFMSWLMKKNKVHHVNQLIELNLIMCIHYQFYPLVLEVYWDNRTSTREKTEGPTVFYSLFSVFLCTTLRIGGPITSS